TAILFTATTMFAKTKIVTTAFPVYDWTREIVGNKTDEVEISLLIENGVDIHSYQPTVQDIAKISNADIFIYIGGESEDWVEDILKSLRNKKLLVVNLLDELGNKAKTEEFIEGMQNKAHHHKNQKYVLHEHEEDDDDKDEDHEHEIFEHNEYDEHIWLSLTNAKILSKKITDAICKKDSKNSKVYKNNLNLYLEKLDSLDKDFKTVVKNANTKTLLFGDRFPFRYFTDDYDLEYYAAFSGCSAETEASFKTVVFLSEKLDQLKLKYVCKIEGGDGKIARTIIENSKSKNAKILTFDSMQSVTKRDIKSGTTYITLSRKNLETLKEALK
ncbi:MAG: zinc ABC transporter substrate-binding protein, partial [Treponema sp.]|nr:zinc ABC transporter substrate-binding protein [Treponema sp.]